MRNTPGADLPNFSNVNMRVVEGKVRKETIKGKLCGRARVEEWRREVVVKRQGGGMGDEAYGRHWIGSLCPHRIAFMPRARLIARTSNLLAQYACRTSMIPFFSRSVSMN